MNRLAKDADYWHVLLPILVGASVYILWRPSGLLWFTWARIAGLEDSIMFIRSIFSPVMECLPFWVLYSLPAALWTYAFTACMLLIWHGKKNF